MFLSQFHTEVDHVKAIFLRFTERKILLMKNEEEASVPEFSSWTFIE